jgi:hypothetical protein
MKGGNKVSCGTALVVLLCVAIIAVLLVKEAKMSDWAAWVQAMGAIGAIWGGFSVAQRAANARAEEEATRRRETSDEQDRRKREMLQLVHAVMYDALVALSEAQKQALNLYGKGSFQLRTARLDDVQYMLRNLLGRELPAGTIEILLHIQAAVSRTLRDVQYWYERHAVYPLPPEQTEKLERRVIQAKADALSLQGFADYWRSRNAQESADTFGPYVGLSAPPGTH